MTEPSTRESPASIDSSEDVIVELLNTQMLAPAEVEEVRNDLLSRCPDARAAAQSLVEQSRLTPYQAEHLLMGRGRELMLGGCRILEPLGEGGMGQVFKAEQTRLNRIVALKVIHPDCLAGGPDVVRRFQREACAAATLSHPNVIAIYDAGQEEDTHFLVMEYAAGMDLAHLIARAGPLPITAACRLVGHAALGLQHAHERGMIHRDIKPSNLFVTRATNAPRGRAEGPASAAEEVQHLLERGVVKILDMGLARFTQALDERHQTALTQDGRIVGTPDFIAPEQARSAKSADIRSDIYSLGCTLYHALTGRLPFPEGTLLEKLLMHQLDEPEPAERLRPDLPGGLTLILRRMMAKKPEDRFQVPEEVHEALTRLGNAAAAVASSSPPVVVRPVEVPRGPSLLPTRVVGPVAGPNRALSKILSPNPSPGRLTPPPGSPASVDTTADPGKHTRSRVSSWKGDASAPGTGPGVMPARELMRLKGHKGCAVCLAFGPDRNTLASAGVDKTVRVWDFSRGEPVELAVLQVPAEEVSALAFLDRRILAAGTDRGKVLLWDLSTPANKLLDVAQGHRQRVNALAAATDRRSLASAGADQDAHVWELEAGKLHLRASLTGHGVEATAVAFAPDGKRLATGAQDGSLRLWLPRRFFNRELVKVRPSQFAVTSLAFTADGNTLACGCFDQTYHLWRVKEDGLQRQSSGGPREGQVRAVQFPPGESTLVTLEDKGRRCTWDAAGATLLETWTVPIANVYSFAMTYDGRYLATGGSDGRVIVYRTAQKRKKS